MTFNASSKLKNMKTRVFHFIRKKIILTILCIYFSSQVKKVKKKKKDAKAHDPYKSISRPFIFFS